MKFVIADDHPAIIAGTEALLRASFGDLEVVEARDYPELLGVLSENEDVDLILMDLMMPGASAFSGLEMVLAAAPEIPVTVISGNVTPEAVDSALKKGASGFLPKGLKGQETISAIRDILAGKVYVPSEVAGLPASDAGEGPSAGLDGVLSLLTTGVIQLDRSCRVQFLNRQAGEFLAARDGLFIDRSGYLRTSNAAFTQAIHAKISRVASGEQPEDAFAVERPSMASPFSVLVRSFKVESANGRVQAVLFVTDPDAAASPSESVFASLFELTPKEARLLKSLVEGKTLEEAATAFGVKLDTVRKQLKSIFMKTGTSRQAELVRLAMLGPSVVTTDPGPAS